MKKRQILTLGLSVAMTTGMMAGVVSANAAEDPVTLKWIQVGGGMPKKLRNAKDEFTEWLCARLDNVTIENRDALDVISTYDSPDTFHFVDPPYINSDCGHYEGTFDEYCMEKLLQLLEQVKGKFMLTMFPLPMIEEYANKNGWIIHRVERTISASKTSRRKQEEWMVCNYEEHPQRTLFDYKDCGVVDTTDAS